MEGRIIWWNSPRTCGLVSVTENDETRNYWLLLSRIKIAPAVIEPGDIAVFTDTLPPLRPNLLPLAVGVVVKKNVDAGVAALATSQAEVKQ
jgi:hypothetical protein